MKSISPALYKLFFSLFFLLGLSACASHLNKAQCLSMDWYQVGFQDGKHGKAERDLSPSISDCARFAITVNTTRYRTGWRAGIAQYCMPQTAYNIGVEGGRINNLCPESLSKEFDQAYRRGLRKYCIPATGYTLGRSGQPFPGFCVPNQKAGFQRSYDEGRRTYLQIQGLRRKINALNDEYKNLKNQIQRYESRNIAFQKRLIHNKKGAGKVLTPDSRRLLLLEIKINNQEIRKFQRQLMVNRRQVGLLHSRLARVQSK